MTRRGALRSQHPEGSEPAEDSAGPVADEVVAFCAEAAATASVLRPKPGTSFTPAQERAVEILEEVFNRERETEEARLSADESLLIRKVASRLTGMAVVSDPDETRLAVRHHLQEFLAALSIPPGTDQATVKVLQREAVTMLLKMAPRDDVDRMMISQLIACHMAAMTCFARAADPEGSPELFARFASHAQKMTRSFTELERAIRQRRRQMGVPKDPTSFDAGKMADLVVRHLWTHGIHLEEGNAQA